MSSWLPRVLFGALAGGVLAGQLSALPLSQSPPNLAGHWVLDQEFVRRDGPRVPFCGVECVITQSDDTLTLKSGQRTLTYRADGNPVRTISARGEFKTEIVQTTRWEGATLMITTKAGDLPDSTIRVSRKNGKMLVEGPSGLLGDVPAKVLYSLKSK